MVTKNCQGVSKKLIPGSTSDITSSKKRKKDKEILTSSNYREFNIIYFNAISIANKKDSLNAMLQQYSYDFIFISETWLRSYHLTSSFIANSPYSMFRCDRVGRHGGGVAALCKTELAPYINILNYNSTEGFELMAFDYCPNKNNHFRFINIYLPPSSSKSITDVSNLILALNTLLPKQTPFHPIYMVGDFNFSGVNWASIHQVSNQCFLLFKDFLDTHCLTQLIQEPTHSHGNTLDLFITSHTSTVSKIDIREPFTLTCDHNMVEITISLLNSKRKAFNKKRNFYRANFTEINKFLKIQQWNKILNQNLDINQIYKNLTEVIHTSIAKFVPFSRPFKKPTYPKNIRAILSQKKKLYKRMKDDPSLQDLYKETSKKYKQCVANYTIQREREIMTSNNKKLFYSYIKRKFHCPSHIPPLHDTNNQIITDSELKANLINNYFSSVFSTSHNNSTSSLPSFSHDFNIMPDFYITPNDVNLALIKLKPSVCHTPDEIPAIFLKYTSSSLSVPLSDFFNISLNRGSLPCIWKMAHVKPIEKPGRTLELKHLRPVSLTSAPCRLMETIISDKIVLHLENNNLLCNLQHGFTPRHSTLTQQLCFLNKVTIMKNNKDPCIAAYIDFTKAFDKISHNKLILVLNHFKINYKVITWIKSLLSERQQQTIVDGILSSSKSVTSGVPQGSVLGPRMFALYVESLLRILSTECNSAFIYAYADDVKILSSSDNEIQRALTILNEWAMKWDLSVQPAKSESISFNLSRATINNNFKINNIPIPIKNSIKDLGVILNNDLKWSPQIKNVTSKASRLIYTVLKSFKTKDPNFYINLYKTHILPIIEYNSTTWNPNLITETQDLEKIQQRFTKQLCKTTNIKFSDYYHRLKILKLETLEERRIKQDLIILYKILNDIIDVDFKDSFKLNNSIRQLRGHNLRLINYKFSGSTVRHNFFSNRIIPIWNRLPEKIVNSKDVIVFKANLKQYSIYNIYNSKLK